MSLRGLGRIALVGCTLAAAMIAGHAHADSAVWVLRGERNSVYIAGSIHALPTNDSRLPATIERAYADAEALVMELDMDDLNEAELVREMMQRGTLEGKQSLRSLVPESEYAAIAKRASEYGLPLAAIEKLEPWLIALLFTELALTRSGFDSKLGVEQQLAARAKPDGKPIIGLESASAQFDVFDAQSYTEQIKFLASTTADLPQVDEQMHLLVGAWRTANLDLVEREMRAEFRDTPKLYAALMKQRHAHWVPQLLALRAEPRDYLVVVGAMHLVGPDSVIRMLERRGAKLARLR